MSGAQDSVICDSIDMNRSTFSAIKKRLRARAIYKGVLVPNPNAINLELFCVTYGAVRYSKPGGRGSYELGTVLRKFDESVFAASDVSSNSVTFAVTPSYTVFEKRARMLRGIYLDYGYSDRYGFNAVLFPFQLSNFYSFFDSAPLLKKILQIEPEFSDMLAHMPHPSDLRDHEAMEVSPIAAKVYSGLVNFADGTDQQIAKQVGVSRHTVAKFRRIFFDNNMLLPRLVPNFEGVGLNLMVLIHLRFSPRTEVEKVRRALQSAEEGVSPILAVQNSHDAVLLAMFPDFSQFQLEFGRFQTAYAELFAKEPITTVLSIPHLTYLKNFVFGPMVEATLATSVSEKIKAKK